MYTANPQFYVRCESDLLWMFSCDSLRKPFQLYKETEFIESVLVVSFK